MNVKPLFHNGQSYEPEDLMRYLDLPGDHHEKRAFLNACVTDPKLARAWEETQKLIHWGNALSHEEPPASIRSQVLEMAVAEHNVAEHNNVKALPSQTSKTTSTQKWALSFAWAASIFMMSYSVYIQSQSSYTSTNSSVDTITLESLNRELLTLEEDLQSLQMSMGVENTEWNDSSSNT